MLDKINQARQAGYSNSEIADYLGSEGFGDKINQARQSGYSDDEIVNFLGTQTQPQQSTQEVKQNASWFNPNFDWKSQQGQEIRNQAKQNISNNVKTVGNFALGLPQGLGNSAIGVTQAISDSINPNSQFSQNIAKNIQERKIFQSQLPGAQQVGIGFGNSILPSLLSPNKLGLVKGAALSGAIAGGTSMQTQPTDLKARGEKAAAEGILSAGTAGIIKAGSNLVGSAIGGISNAVKGAKAPDISELDNIGQNLKAQSQATYKTLDDAGILIESNNQKKIADKISESIDEFDLEGRPLTILNRIKSYADEGKLNFKELDKARSAFSRAVRSGTDFTGKQDSSAYLANKAINKIDDIIDNLGPNEMFATSGNLSGDQIKQLVNTAKDQWKNYRQFDTISGLVKKSDNDPNLLKAALTRFTNKEKNLQGLPEQTKAALINASKNSAGEKALKSIGKFGFDMGTSRGGSGNTVIPAILSGEAAVYQNPYLASAVGAGTAARQLNKLIARGKIQDVLDLIENAGRSQGAEMSTQLISQITNKKAQQEIVKNLLTKSLATNIAHQATQ